MERQCRYCNAYYQQNKRGEHVFPYGLGGEDLYMDCVCNDCNKYFSNLEIELIQKSPVGIMRSTEGVEGYNTNKQKPSPFKAPLLLTFDKENEIVYEVGQFYKMQMFIRPQIIKIKDQYYLEADTEDGKKKLHEQYKKWTTTSLKMIIQKPASKGNPIRFAEFKKTSDHYCSEIKNENIKVKNEILLTILPESYEHYTFVSPRLYIDDDNNLRVRAKAIDEAINFLNDFLNLCLKGLTLHSFGHGNFNQPVVNTGFSFDAFKLEQALVKIGINCLIYYFPKIKNEPSLNDSISFVMKGQPLIPRAVDKKFDIIDSLEKTHNIFFYQAHDGITIRISLFNGSFIFTFFIAHLKLLQLNAYNKLVIDYVKPIS